MKYPMLPAVQTILSGILTQPMTVSDLRKELLSKADTVITQECLGTVNEAIRIVVSDDKHPIVAYRKPGASDDGTPKLVIFPAGSELINTDEE